MKHYTVEITNEALADMEQLYNHIAYVLQAPENAMDQYNRIADAILTLDTMAERIRIMESEPERSKEMRRLLVDNYSVFFVIQGDKVIVTDVLYSAYIIKIKYTIEGKDYICRKCIGAGKKIPDKGGKTDSDG